MSRQVLVLRPEPGLTSTLVAAFERGLPAKGMPLARVEPVAWRAPAEKYDALLIGSANALRHAGKELDKVAHLPVLSVGDATAQAAAAAGLQVEHVGGGGLQSVLDALPPTPRHLLRLAGEKHLPLSVPDQIRIETVVTYSAKYYALSAKQAEVLAEGALILLHSGEMARHFAEQCEELGVEKSRVMLAAMAPRIAEMAGNGWESVHIATEKNDSALLDLAAELCNR